MKHKTHKIYLKRKLLETQNINKKNRKFVIQAAWNTYYGYYISIQDFIEFDNIKTQTK